MTDAEIIKALEICADDEKTCDGCVFHKDNFCGTDLEKAALDLIHRQKAEIALKTEYIQEQRDVIAELKDKIESFADRIVEQLEECSRTYCEEYGYAEDEYVLYLPDAIAIVKGVQNE